MMTDEEALATARYIMRRSTDSITPFQKEVFDLCLWVEDISNRLPKPKRDRKEYMRDYMRLKRARERIASSESRVAGGKQA